MNIDKLRRAVALADALENELMQRPQDPPEPWQRAQAEAAYELRVRLETMLRIEEKEKLRSQRCMASKK